MSVWYKVAWIDPLFARFNTLWPNRQHGQDGTIGDPAHQAETSGHNPDDTPGVKAERQDTDSKPEVRAADVDARGADMEAAVQAILHGPADERDRLIYIIFNRRIWRKATKWAPEVYTGSDPHDTHGHFSGDPASDEDGRPWTFLEDDMTPEQDERLKNIDKWCQGIAGQKSPVTLTSNGQPSDWPNQLAGAIKDLQSRPPVQAAPVDQTALVQAVRDALADPVTLAAIAKAVADEQYRRQAA